MKAGIVPRVALMIGLIVAFAPAVQAGGAGGGGGGIVVPLVCYEINGDDANATANITSELRGPETLRLGNARLVCTPTTVLTVNGSELQSDDTATHLKCYSTSGPRLGPQPDTTLTDGVVGTETAPLARTSHLCVPTTIDD